MLPDRNSYADRFDAMVDELRAHPDVAVLRYYRRPGVDRATVERVHDALGFALSDEVLAFYRQANGLSLHWAPRKTPGFRANARERAEPFEMVPSDHCGRHGLVHLLPLEDLRFDYDGSFHFEDSDEQIELGGRTYRAGDFTKSLRAIDYYSEYTMAAFALDGRPPSPPVVFGDDHGASFTTFAPMSFWDYLERVLAVYGSYRARERLIVLEQPPALAWTEWLAHAPSLDALVAEQQLGEQAWHRRVESGVLPLLGATDDEEEEEDDDDDGWDEGDGPRLGDDVVFVGTVRTAWPGWKTWLKSRRLPESIADRVFVMGGPAAIKALTHAHPDHDTSAKTAAAEEQVAVSFQRFLLMGTHRPNVRVPRGSCWQVQQNLDLAETLAFYDARGIRALTLKDVGLLRDEDSSIHFDPMPGLPITELRR